MNFKKFIIHALGGKTNDEHEAIKNDLLKNCEMFAIENLRPINGEAILRMESINNRTISCRLFVIGSHSRINNCNFSENIVIAPWVKSTSFVSCRTIELEKTND